MRIIKYPYSENDCFEFPQKYQMSEFCGVDFLRAYKKTRNEVIEQINIAKEKNQKVSNHNSEFYENEYLNMCDKKPFQTEKIFCFIYSKILENDLKIEYSKLINKFIKKFEISKKIFDYYEYDLSTKSNNFRTIKNYLILSEICIKLYEEKGNLKYLNTSLKINDIICSNFKKITNESELRSLKEILTSELKEVENLMVKKGIELI